MTRKKLLICSERNLSGSNLRRALLVVLLVCLAPFVTKASPRTTCQRPAVGSNVPEPEDLRSENGVLKLELTFRNFIEPDGEVGYCYIYKDGSEAPTLRLKPGDWLELSLKNELSTAIAAKQTLTTPVMALSMSMSKAPCGGGTKMSATATNLHFHGLTVPSACHEDDVLQTAVDPSGTLEYKFQIPSDEPPGLYWYHPHIHGYAKVQVLGGASGALIIEGLQRAEHDVAGLPERVFVIRDQDLVNPNAAPLDIGPKPPPVLLDNDGEVLNTGSGTGKPAKDLSINFVPVSFPQYKPAVLQMRPLERQLWRVVNASAITYLNLQVMYNDLPQQIEIVAMDGVPLNENGLGGRGVVFENHVGLPPGGRAEFIVKGPPAGVKAVLLTRSVNTGPAGENDPVRPLAEIIASSDAPEPPASLPADTAALPPPAYPWVGNVTPVRTRKLYFTEEPSDPKDPNSPTVFMLTVDGQAPKPFDPNSYVPNIIAHQGDVEDWIIENRTQELHAFHIHQLHFVLMDWFGIKVSEPFLRDTINVPFWDGKSLAYPSVRIRMDFRDPNTVGTFIYHCHLLEHEDGGMMGIIRVEPRGQQDESHKTPPAEPKRVSSLISATKRHILCGAPSPSKSGS